MQLKINGKPESIEGKTILDIIKNKQLNAEHIVIEHNKQVIPQEKWDNTSLNENDNLEIVSFVGGG
jgi:sulfur carrier protein